MIATRPVAPSAYPTLPCDAAPVDQLAQHPLPAPGRLPREWTDGPREGLHEIWLDALAKSAETPGIPRRISHPSLPTVRPSMTRAA